MDWYLLRYFLAVAELGNFSRAAGRMNVTQPTLSAGIAKLEAQLGQKLFERDRRRVSLTEAGSRFLAHAQRIARDYEIALRDISQAAPRRTLRAGVLSTFPSFMLEALVSSHAAQENAETLELLDGSERELKTWLDDERIELALTLLRPGSPAPAQESLYREDYVLVTSTSHRLAHMQAVKGEELAKDAMIIRRHCEVLAATSQYFTQRGVRPSFALKTTNDDKALALVRAGLGVTVMPESFAGNGIVPVRMLDFDFSREVGIVYSAKGRMLANSGCCFVETLRRELARPER
jgi:DNA-binding transcriptional LysR family regulator